MFLSALDFETFCFHNHVFGYKRSRCFASPCGFDYGLRPSLRMTHKHCLARVILSERSESNCEAVGGEAEQDLTCHAGSRRLEKGYFIKEREGKPLPYRNVIFLHSAKMFVRTVCLKAGG